MGRVIAGYVLAGLLLLSLGSPSGLTLGLAVVWVASKTGKATQGFDSGVGQTQRSFSAVREVVKYNTRRLLMNE